jgi:hypothetical protein
MEFVVQQNINTQIFKAAIVNVIHILAQALTNANFLIS